MKASVNRQELAEALGVVGGVLSVRTTKPILQCVLVRVEADCAILGATDLEVSVRQTVSQIEVAEPGDVLLSADKLTKIVRESADEVLELETEENICHVRGADSHFQLVSQDAREFPAIAEMQTPADFEIEAGVLRRLVDWTVFAAARENTRYAINGVLWERKGKKLTLVSTDGRRLSLACGTVSKGSDGDVQVIVPTKAMHLLQRMVTDDQDKVSVKATDNQILLSTRRATVGAALVEGRFPQYQDVIPQDNDKRVVVRTEEFLSAVKRAALLTNDESKGVKMLFDKGTLALSSRAPEQGEACVTMPVDYNGERIEIGFNPIFLTEALRVVFDETVTFEFKAANRPGVIRCGADFQYIVMPINL